MATRHNDPSRSTPEWPPHPDRLYSALVAAADPEDCDNERAAALRWLAKQGAPRLAAPEARRREAPEVHMPTNPHPTEIPASLEPGPRTKDREKRRKELADAVRNLLPVHRKKAALPIPAVIPDDPTVYFIWPTAEPAASVLSTLKTICERVTYLGRSRSLVRVSLADAPPPATHVPDAMGQVQLRVPGPDRLCYLIDKYQRDGGKPEPSPPRRYRVVEQDLQQEVSRSTFDRTFIFRPQAGDPALPAEATLKVTKAFRQGLLRRVHEQVCQCGGWVSAVPRCADALDCYRKIPTLISGYDIGDKCCTPTKSPHLAFAALPFVHPYRRHADGSIKGLAVLVPRDPKPQALELLATGLIRLSEVGLPVPGVGTWRLEEVPADNPPLQTLDMRSWTGPSRVWATVTPMVFGHVPKEKKGGEPAVILDSLRMIGRDLPGTVVEIAVGRYSPLHGPPPSWQFKPRLDGATGEPAGWMLRHVTLRFSQGVRGPLVLGRMRYFGLGLMRPMEERAWPS
jgi:CRISPR-associated protein Csb2